MFWVMFISVTMVGLGLRKKYENIHMLSKKLSYDNGLYLIIIFQKAPIFLLLSNLVQHWADSRTGYNLPGYTVTAFAHTLLDENMIYARMQYLKTKLGYNLPGYTVTAFAHTHLEQNMIYCFSLYTQYIYIRM